MKGNILLTRLEADAVKDAAEFAALGLNVFICPAIETRLLKDLTKPDLTNYAWIVFTSKNAVRYLKHIFADLPQSCKIAAQASETANEVYKVFNRTPDFISQADDSPEFAQELVKIVSGLVLIPASTLTRNEVSKKLSAEGIANQVYYIYETISSNCDPEKLNEFKASLEPKFIAFFSPSAVRSLASQFDLTSAHLIALGKVTAAEIKSLGFTVFCEAEKSNKNSLIQALKNKL